MDRSSILQEETNLPKNHTAARRIDFSDYDSSTLYTIIEDYCVRKNEPLVISNLHKTEGWDDQVFRLDQLKQFRGDSVFKNKLATTIEKHNLGEFITTLQERYNLGVGDQDKDRSSTPPQNKHRVNSQNKVWKRDQKKLYGKDITCPSEYDAAMKKFLPEYLIPKGNCDLFSFLPPRFQAENLMCYLGQDDTGTPIHRDLCGTMGHNIMTMATPGGYAEWIIILNRDRDTLASYIKPSAKENQMINRKDRDKNSAVSKSSFMESDRAWLSQETIINSTLNVQVIIQRPGDLVIIPSRAYHQVRNVGVSIKIAWNRITPQSLHSAFEDQLPMYQIINRPEVYKCKAIVNYSIQKWNEYLSSANDWEDFCKLEVMRYTRHTFINDVKMLADLYYNKVLLPEVLEPSDDEGVYVDEDPAEFCTVICDFCHSDVFYRYYHCKKCDDYDLCMGCYSIGRSCQHVDEMYMCRSPVTFSSLIELYTSFVANVNRIYESQEKDALIDQSHALYNPSTLNNAPTLATLCRRIERFRKENGQKCSQLTCTHCAHKTKLAFEKKERVSVFYAFQRYPCPKARPKFKDSRVDLYVCDACSSECDSCQTILVPKLTIEYDLVYFTHPALDNRNWGAYFDSNINRSCFYPKVFYETFTESKNNKKKKKPTAPKKPKKATSKPKKQKEDDAEFQLDQAMEDPSDHDEKIVPAALTRPKRVVTKLKKQIQEAAELEVDQDIKEVEVIPASSAPKKLTKKKIAPRKKKEEDSEFELDQTMRDPSDDEEKTIPEAPTRPKRAIIRFRVTELEADQSEDKIIPASISPTKHTKKKGTPRKKKEEDTEFELDQAMEDPSDADDDIISVIPKKHTGKKTKPKKKKDGDDEFDLDQSMEDRLDIDKILPTASKKRKISKRKGIEVDPTPSSITTTNDEPTTENIPDVTTVIVEEKEEKNEEELPNTKVTLASDIAEDIENKTIEHFNRQELIISNGDTDEELIDIESPDEDEQTIHNKKSEYVANIPVETKLDNDCLDITQPEDFIKEVPGQISCEPLSDIINSNSFEYLAESGLVSTENEPVHTIII